MLKDFKEQLHLATKKKKKHLSSCKYDSYWLLNKHIWYIPAHGVQCCLPSTQKLFRFFFPCAIILISCWSSTEYGPRRLQGDCPAASWDVWRVPQEAAGEMSGLKATASSPKWGKRKREQTLPKKKAAHVSKINSKRPDCVKRQQEDKNDANFYLTSGFWSE